MASPCGRKSQRGRGEGVQPCAGGGRARPDFGTPRCVRRHPPVRSTRVRGRPRRRTRTPSLCQWLPAPLAMDATGIDATDQGLRAWAEGVYPQEAAVELLIRTWWTRRCAFKDEVVIDDNGRPWLDWDRLKPSSTATCPARSSQHRAASCGCCAWPTASPPATSARSFPAWTGPPPPWSLQPSPTPTAPTSTTGRSSRTPMGDLSTRQATRFTVAALGSLHPWPENEPH